MAPSIANGPPPRLASFSGQQSGEGLDAGCLQAGVKLDGQVLFPRRLGPQPVLGVDVVTGADVTAAGWAAPCTAPARSMVLRIVPAAFLGDPREQDLELARGLAAECQLDCGEAHGARRAQHRSEPFRRIRPPGVRL